MLFFLNKTKQNQKPNTLLQRKQSSYIYITTFSDGCDHCNVLKGPFLFSFTIEPRGESNNLLNRILSMNVEIKHD